MKDAVGLAKPGKEAWLQIQTTEDLTSILRTLACS